MFSTVHLYSLILLTKQTDNMIEREKNTRETTFIVTSLNNNIISICGKYQTL